MHVRFIGRGKNSAVFACRGVAVKLMMLDDADPGDNSCDVEVRMLRLGEKLRASGVTPHLPRMYRVARAGVSSHELLRCMPPGRRGRVSHILCMEKFDASLRRALETGLVGTDDQLRALVFQVLYTVAALAAAIPGFRHNDLSTRNVLVKRCPVAAEYTLAAGRRYSLDADVRACLADFDFCHANSCPPLHNARVLGGKYGIRNDTNPSYDTNLFLFSLRQSLPPAKFPQTRAWLAGLPIAALARTAAPIPDLEPLALLATRYFDALREVRPTANKFFGAYRIVAADELCRPGPDPGVERRRGRGRARPPGLRLEDHLPGRVDIGLL